jgi:hypothetical protein
VIFELKTEREIALSQHESLCVQTIIGSLCIHPAFPYRTKRKAPSGNFPIRATQRIFIPDVKKKEKHSFKDRNAPVILYRRHICYIERAEGKRKGWSARFSLTEVQSHDAHDIEVCSKKRLYTFA